MAELKPCPFCGFKMVLVYNDNRVVCGQCSVQIKRETKKKAIEAWNRRTENEELKFTREFIHEHGLEFALASAWNRRVSDG